MQQCLLNSGDGSVQDGGGRVALFFYCFCHSNRIPSCWLSVHATSCVHAALSSYPCESPPERGPVATRACDCCTIQMCRSFSWCERRDGPNLRQRGRDAQASHRSNPPMLSRFSLVKQWAEQRPGSRLQDLIWDTRWRHCFLLSNHLIMRGT